MHRVPLDLAHRKGLLIHVRENPAGRLAVEADARDDPVAPPLLARPARGLVVHVVVPFRRIGMTLEVRHRFANCALRVVNHVATSWSRPDGRLDHGAHNSQLTNSPTHQFTNSPTHEFTNSRIHDNGTDCPASTQMYSHAAPPASVSSAASEVTSGCSVAPNMTRSANGSRPPPIMATPQKSLA